MQEINWIKAAMFVDHSVSLSHTSPSQIGIKEMREGNCFGKRQETRSLCCHPC